MDLDRTDIPYFAMINHSSISRRDHSTLRIRGKRQRFVFNSVMIIVIFILSCLLVYDHIFGIFYFMNTQRVTDPFINHPTMRKSDEHSAPYWRARVRGSPDETSPCTLMASGACKIRRGCNILQVPIQIIPLGVAKLGSHPFCGGSKL